MTTLTLLKAMASAARIGCNDLSIMGSERIGYRTPAASGMSATF